MIYTVTTIEDLVNLASPSRCVGWCETEEAARMAVETNEGDIYEGCFDYVVIECSGPGMFYVSKQVQWYEWKDGAYREIECPERIKKVVNWGIG